MKELHILMLPKKFQLEIKSIEREKSILKKEMKLKYDILLETNRRLMELTIKQNNIWQNHKDANQKEIKGSKTHDTIL